VLSSGLDKRLYHKSRLEETPFPVAQSRGRPWLFAISVLVGALTVKAHPNAMTSLVNDEVRWEDRSRTRSRNTNLLDGSSLEERIYSGHQCALDRNISKTSRVHRMNECIRCIQDMSCWGPSLTCSSVVHSPGHRWLDGLRCGDDSSICRTYDAVTISFPAPHFPIAALSNKPLHTAVNA
jgi:hypothetical protein